MIKSLRVKHYSYLILAALLVVTSFTNIILNLRTAQAETGTVTITSPSENEEIGQQTRQITGTAPALKEVTVFDGTEKIGTTTSSGAGTWSLTWEDPVPGQHELRATVTDGLIYTSDFLSANSVKSIGINNNQVVQSFAAGLAGAKRVFYDSSLQKAYVVNHLSGTISQIDPVTKQIDATINYADMKQPGSHSCALNDGLTCAYTYDEQSHHLYVFDNSKLYAINTQAKTLEFTITTPTLSTNDGQIKYRSYLDPQKENLYLMIDSDYGAGATPVINLQAQTLDNTQVLGKVVVSSGGDIYSAPAFGGPPQVKRTGSDSWEEINIPNQDCQFNSFNNRDVALSKDESRLYIACSISSSENPELKLIALNTADLSVISTFDRAGEFLNPGNLTSEKLLINNKANNRIEVFDTSSDQFVSAVQPLDGDLESGSIVVNGENEKLYFTTLDTDAALNHAYTVDLHTSGIVHEGDYSTTEFGGVQSASLSELAGYLFISRDSNEAVHTLDLDNGDLSTIQSGMGGAQVATFYAKAAKRIFSLSQYSAPANQISVGSTEDASYVGKVSLPGPYFAAGAVLNQQQTKLYVLGKDGADFGGEPAMKLFEVDVTTLQVTQIYDSLNQYATGDFSGRYSEISIGGNLLAFTDTETIFILDLTNDTTRTIPAVTAGNAFAGRSVLSEDGSRMAVITGYNQVTIINTANMQTVRTLDASNQGGLIVSSLAFGQNDTLLVGKMNFGGSGFSGKSSLGSYSLSSGSQLKVISLSDTGLCMPGLITPSVEPHYVSVFSFCLNLQNQNQTEYYATHSVVDIENGTLIHSKTTNQSITLVGITQVGGIPGTDLQVLSASRHITVRANQVNITSPTEAQTVNAGDFTITGTAPPSGTVLLSIDGQSIGSMQADEYGAWSKVHNFPTKKTYQIKAQYTNPAQSLRYLTGVDLDPTPSEEFAVLLKASGFINVFDTAKNKIIEKIPLPDSYISNSVRLSKDGTQLLIVGLKQVLTDVDDDGEPDGTSDAALFRFNLATKQFESPVVFADTATNTDALIGLGFGIAFSDDESQVYITDQAGVKIFSSSGNLLSSISADFSVPEDDNNPPRMIVAEAAQRLYFATSHKITIINLSNGQISSIELPQEAELIGLNYDKLRNNIISVVRTQSGSVTTSVSAGTPQSNPNWMVVNDNFMQSGSTVISPDGQQLYMAGAHFTNSEDLRYGVVTIKLDSGQASEKFQPPSTELLQMITSLSSVGVVSTHALKLNAEGTVLYYDNIIPVAAGGVLSVASYLNSDQPPKVIRVEPSYSFYTYYTNVTDATSSRLIPGSVLQAERSLVVANSAAPETPQTNTTTPLPPRAVVPQEPTATDPADKTPDSQPVSSASKTNKKRAVAALEKRALSRSFFAIAQLNTKKLFAKLPLPVIKSVPYVLYLALLGLAGYYLYQTQKQLRREERVRSILKRQQVLTEEKRNFLELTSHYLRTPLTYIRSGAEMSARKTGNEALASDMSQAVNHLSLFVESLIEEAGTEKNQEALKEVKIKSPLLSRHFLFPAVGLVASLGIFYLLSSGLAGINLPSTAYFTHVVLTILIVRLFYGMLKNHRLVVAERTQMGATLKAERELDHARSKLLEDAGEQLKTRTDHIAGLSNQLTDDDTSKRIIQQGVERLQELSRAFRLVCKLEAQALVPRMKPVTAEALASEVVAPFKDQLAKKKLTLNVTGFTEDVILTTNKPLAQLTLRSLIENAIQASQEGDALVVKCLHSDGHTAFQVIDHGEGIPKEKLAQLFKPFVRVGPVTTFNREGIGLSLFLDRLIMHSLGGEVEIMSKFEQGTVATLTFATETAQ